MNTVIKAIMQETYLNELTIIFSGVMNNDYSEMAFADYNTISSYSALGGAPCIISNLVSHTFDLRGPSATVDRACASSMTAMHLGAQAITCGNIYIICERNFIYLCAYV